MVRLEQPVGLKKYFMGKEMDKLRCSVCGSILRRANANGEPPIYKCGNSPSHFWELAVCPSGRELVGYDPSNPTPAGRYRVPVPETWTDEPNETVPNFPVIQV